MKIGRWFLALLQALALAAVGGFAIGGVLAMTQGEGPVRAGAQFSFAMVVVVGSAILGLGLALLMIRYGLLFAVVGLGMLAAGLAMGGMALRLDTLDTGQRVMFGLMMGPLFALLGIAMLVADLRMRFGGE